MDDMDAVRLDSLATAVVAAEQAHAAIVAAWGADAPTRELAIAAVLTEATAYWTIELRPGEGLDACVQVSNLLTGYLTEQARSIVFALIPADVRTRGRARVIADMMGPGDDDGE